MQRHPVRPDGPLRAWDAADEYLLAALDEAGARQEAAPLGADVAVRAAAGGRLLVINDRFGALAVALAARRPVVWSDSFLARLALRHNLAANGLDPGAVAFAPADGGPPGEFDLVVARIPKSLAYWEDLLLRLRAHLGAGSLVVAGAMIKHTPARAYRLLEEIVGPARTSLGWKKARLVRADFAPRGALPERLPDTAYELDGLGFTLSNGPNVYARERLDLGVRALLPYLPAGAAALHIADLGCGNGVLSLALAARNPTAAVLGIDESYQAVASARANAARAGFPVERLSFEVGDGLAAVPAGALDLVVCNPPFHQDHTISDQTAWAMFLDARRALRPDGRLLVVGNRRLDYPRALARLFARVAVLADDGRFVVVQAVATV